MLLCPRLRDFERGKGRGALLLIPSGTANAMRKDRSCSVRVDCDVAVSTATDFFLFFPPLVQQLNAATMKKFVAEFGLQVGYLDSLRSASGSPQKDRTSFWGGGEG